MWVDDTTALDSSFLYINALLKEQTFENFRYVQVTDFDIYALS